jgi:hypothetical protein
MRYVLKLACLILAVMLVSQMSAEVFPKVAVARKATGGPVPYQPALRQGGVLFVEDGAGYDTWGGTPDPLWLGLLTDIYGTGNFGWFGPTEVPEDSGPTLATMMDYEAVVWNNYDHWDTPTLLDYDMDNIEDYLTAGGHVLLIGQDLIYACGGSIMPWLNNNFGLDAVIEDYCFGDTFVNIEGQNELASGTFLVTADYTVNERFFADDLTPTVGVAHEAIYDADSFVFPGILMDDGSSSFWTIDGRQPDPAVEFETIVTALLVDVFGVTGTAEIPSEQVEAQGIMLTSSPSAFKITTTLSYFIQYPGQVQVKVYNEVGELVKTLVDAYQDQGAHTATWDGTSTSGVRVPNGVYFAQVIYGSYQSTTKLVFMQ